MTQLLETVAIGDVAITEGILTSNIPDHDYEKFKKMCIDLTDKINTKDDPSTTKRNQKLVVDALNKKRPIIMIHGRAAQLIKAKMFDDVPSADEIKDYLISSYKMQFAVSWLVTYMGGTMETEREIKFWGPLGDQGWLMGNLHVKNYRDVFESYRIMMGIRPIREKDKRKYSSYTK